MSSFPFLKRFLAIVLTILLSVACQDEVAVPQEVLDQKVQLDLERFDVRFANATPDSLPQLKREFPYLFPQQYDASFWNQKLEDTIQQELNTEVVKAFPDFEEHMQDLDLLFKHIKYYYPKVNLPEVVTITSDVDHKNRVILTDSLLIIGLDNYLGPEHKFYRGIQRYFATNFRPEQIDVNVAEAFVDKLLGKPRNRRFLDEMIYQGKKLYIMEKLLTLEPKNEIIGYTPEKLEWAQENEVNIWTYFIERELLFSTDRRLLQRFINPAPFSKFYLEFDNESPPRLGSYIGWQMVKAYMDRTNIPLQMLPGKTADEIFKNANYKPRK